MAEEVQAELVCFWCERQMLKSRTLNWGQQSISSSFSTVGPVHGDFDSKDTMTLNCLQHQWSITAATKKKQLEGPVPYSNLEITQSGPSVVNSITPKINVWTYKICNAMNLL